jgi:hypothetical protein
MPRQSWWFRIVGSGTAVRDAVHAPRTLVSAEQVLDIPAVRMQTLPGFDTAVFPYATDVPLLTRLGTPLHSGPGSVHDVHTDESRRPSTS